jgi:serine/threonine protein kinase
MIKYKINPKYQEAFTPFLKDIQEHFSNNNNSIHKARNEIKVLTHHKEDMVVKSFKIPHLLNRVVYSFFRKSKAKKSYEYSIKILDFVPKPIGYIEFHEKGLLERSYFISEHFNYDFTIREPLLDVNFKDREKVFRAFAKFTLALHNKNIFHKDYSPGNILIKKLDDEFIFKIVDINRMGFFTLSEKDRAKNFSKLWASDEVLKVVSDEYQKHHKCSEIFTQTMLDFNNKNKRIKNFKKRLKGEKVVD